MKTHIFTLVVLFSISCGKTSDVSDMGSDVTPRKMPTAEECFQYTNADDCYAAGCQDFFMGDVIIETSENVCESQTTGVACWTTNQDGLANEGTVFWWYYDLPNGQRKHIYTSGFAGVLGWQACEGDCPCIVEETE